MGFRAMQFNFVVSTNVRAIRLWERLGFSVVGRLPGAFNHRTLGYVDVLIMFKRLAPRLPPEGNSIMKLPPDTSFFVYQTTGDDNEPR